MESLSFTYPSWMLILCGLLGLGYAIFHYGGGKTFKDRPLGWRALMAALRGLGVFLLSALLLSITIKQNQQIIQKPILAVLQDNSRSVKATSDTTMLNALQQSLAGIESDLGESVQVDYLTFGNEVAPATSIDYSDEVSDLSEAYKYILDQYAGQNLAGVVIATDGIRNRGGNPLYFDRIIPAPLFAIALGDTTQYRDLAIKKTYNNKIGYMGDRMAIQVDVEGIGVANNNVSLNLYQYTDEGRNLLESKPLRINNESYYRTEEFIVNLPKAGVQRFRFTINQIEGERITANNYRDVYVEVLDARQQVVIVANAPHPDLAALKSIITSNKNKEVDIRWAKNFDGIIEEYDLVILHNLPSANQSISKLLKDLKTKKKPTLFVSGVQTDLVNFNKSQSLLRITGNRKQYNDAQGLVNQDFTRFTLDGDLKSRIVTFPPLTVPFGTYQTAANADILAFQKIGNVETQYPMLATLDEDGWKVGLLAGEGIWRWRLYNYAQYENFNFVDEVIGKFTNYLTVKEDKRRFRVYPNSNTYPENEPIGFDAEYYNASYEPENEADPVLIIRNAEGNRYDYSFSKRGNQYSLNAGIFEAGSYTWSAEIVDDGESFSAGGAFSVQPLQLELYETTADHGLLHQLVTKQGGEVLYPGEVGRITDILKESNLTKPTTYSTTRKSPILNLKWLLGALLLTFSAEWFLRKFLGAY